MLPDVIRYAISLRYDFAAVYYFFAARRADCHAADYFC